MDISLLYIALGGLIFGGIISLVFNVYSKSTANLLSRNVFGITVSALVFNTIIFCTGLGFALLSGYSALIRDLAYPVYSPLRFTIETLLMGVLPASIIYLMTVFRGYTITNYTNIEFVVLFIKFALLHILLQFSGFYTELFPFKKSSTQ